MTATNPASAPSTPATKNVFRLHGVNVLNRKNVDSIARLTAIEKRRANHILDERQRRDTMNQLLAELSHIVQESETDPISTSSPQPSYTAPHSSASMSTSTLSVSTLDNDTQGKRPPVKSNSITTLRCAIAEIHRLRSYAGLEPIGSNSSSQNSSMSPSRSTSPTSPTSHLAPVPLELQHTTQVPLATHGNIGYNTYTISSMPSSPSGANQPYQTFAPHPLDSTPAPYLQQVLPYQPHSPPLSPNTSAAVHSFPSAYSPVNIPMSAIQEAPSLPTLFAANTLIALASDQMRLPPQHDPSDEWCEKASIFSSANALIRLSFLVCLLFSPMTWIKIWHLAFTLSKSRFVIFSCSSFVPLFVPLFCFVLVLMRLDLLRNRGIEAWSRWLCQSLPISHDNPTLLISLGAIWDANNIVRKAWIVQYPTIAAY